MKNKYTLEDFLADLRALCDAPRVEAEDDMPMDDFDTWKEDWDKLDTFTGPTPRPQSPYHPDYGLTNDTRIRALLIAETSGVKAAAKELNVAVSTIYRWRSDYASSASNT
jgi:hypothetical protein